MNRIHCVWIIPLVLLGLARPAFPGDPRPGDVDDFEKTATTEKPRTEHADSDEDDCDVGDVLGDEATLNLALGVIGGVALGGVGSWARMEGISDPELAAYFSRRRLGEPVIPILGITVSYQEADGDVGAMHYRGEIGYGPLGLSFEKTRYNERRPRDAMDITRVHALYRMSLSNSVELDAGVGPVFLVGNGRHVGTSFTLPFRAHAASIPLGVEFQPTWSWLGGPAVSEYLFTMVLRSSFTSLRAGYRIATVGEESLSGPVIGVSFQL